MYKERIGNLLKEAVRQEPEMSLNDQDSLAYFIEERVNKMIDYTAYVAHMETHMQYLKAMGIEGEEWRDNVMNMDKARRSRHEVALGAVTQLNRLADSFGMEPFYEGVVDNEHRYEVGDLCRDVCVEYFDARSPHPLKANEMMAEDEKAADFASSVEQLSADANGVRLTQ